MSDRNDTLRLEGSLTAREVAALDGRYRERFDRGDSPATVSLAEVENGDSSALALLLEWQARARQSGRDIRFEQPPESLRVIARLTGVAPLLGWDQQDSNAEPAKDPT